MKRYHAVVPLLSVGISHREASPDQLAGLADAAGLVAEQLAAKKGLVEGVVVLTTCNRFEVYVDATTFHGGVGLVMEAVKAALPQDLEPLVGEFYTHGAAGALDHLFRVTAGLESMVVGESEIAGQVRTALAKAGGHVSPRLRRAFQGALTTSKAIASQTALGQVGRSLASVGLDLAAQELPPWETTTALVLGTGQYAGTVVAELTRRGCSRISVYSASGNAERFAATHPVTPVTNLSQGLAQADLCVAASGAGQVKLDASALNLSCCTKVVLDLSGGTDIEGELPVRLVGLAEIGQVSPPERQESIDQAEAMVADGVANLLQGELSRGAAPAITAMRSYVSGIIAAEVSRARAAYPPDTAEAVEKALHRVTGALLHHPSVAAAELAQIGRMGEYHQALETLFGILVEAP